MYKNVDTKVNELLLFQGCQRNGYKIISGKRSIRVFLKTITSKSYGRKSTAYIGKRFWRNEPGWSFTNKIQRFEHLTIPE